MDITKEQVESGFNSILRAFFVGKKVTLPQYGRSCELNNNGTHIITDCTIQLETDIGPCHYVHTYFIKMQITTLKGNNTRWVNYYIY